jgi:UDP-N-acetylmuramoyl-L-alanyl-D-glutamate--2,6-diaminopimelate ligase
VIPLADLVRELGGAADRTAIDSEVPIRDVQIDSRRVARGDLFAAIPGSRADGASFVAEAVERGAAAVLAPAPLTPAPRVPAWIHPSARRVAGEVAARIHGFPARGMPVLAVTGTNGKTTTVHLAAHLLRCTGRRPAALGTVGNVLADGVRRATSHTTPDAPELQRLLAEHRALGGDAVALEASSHALDQERLAGLDVSVAVFTNLTRDHLDYHGDLERYAAAKVRLFAALAPRAVAVLNADDPHSERMARAARAAGASVLTFSTRSRADLWASRAELDSRGARFTVQGMGVSRTRVTSPLIGRFNVENALAALAAVLATGASPSNALEGLATALPAPGRMESVDTAGLGFALYVDYAHTEDALRKALEVVRAALAAEGARRGDHGGRAICVFGCGGDRDRGKRAPMGRAAGALADVVVVTSDNPRGEAPDAIIGEVCSGLAGSDAAVHVEPDRRRAIALAIELAHPGDVVLVAGKGHETAQIVGSRALEFDDCAVARELARRFAERAGRCA